jgi:hypothetical protein
MKYVFVLFFFPLIASAQVKTDASIAAMEVKEIEKLLEGNWQVTKIKIDTVNGYEENFADVQYQFAADKKSKLLIGMSGRPTVSEGTWRVTKEGDGLYLIFNMDWGISKHLIIFIDSKSMQFHETKEGWSTGNIYFLKK